MNNSRFNPNFSIKYPNINVKYDDEVANTFFSYVISGDVNKLNQYVTNNSIPISIKKEKDGYNALHLAVESSLSVANKLNLIKYLILNYIPINDRDSQGNTPLLMACKKNEIEIVDLLLKNNANPSIKNIFGITPLHFAASGKIESCKNTKIESIIKEPDTKDFSDMEINQFSLEVKNLYMELKNKGINLDLVSGGKKNETNKNNDRIKDYLEHISKIIKDAETNYAESKGIFDQIKNDFISEYTTILVTKNKNPDELRQEIISLKNKYIESYLGNIEKMDNKIFTPLNLQSMPELNFENETGLFLHYPNDNKEEEDDDNKYYKIDGNNVTLNQRIINSFVEIEEQINEIGNRLQEESVNYRSIINSKTNPSDLIYQIKRSGQQIQKLELFQNIERLKEYGINDEYKGYKIQTGEKKIFQAYKDLLTDTNAENNFDIKELDQENQTLMLDYKVGSGDEDNEYDEEVKEIDIPFTYDDYKPFTDARGNSKIIEIDFSRPVSMIFSDSSTKDYFDVPIKIPKNINYVPKNITYAALNSVNKVVENIQQDIIQANTEVDAVAQEVKRVSTALEVDEKKLRKATQELMKMGDEALKVALRESRPQTIVQSVVQLVEQVVKNQELQVPELTRAIVEAQEQAQKRALDYQVAQALAIALVIKKNKQQKQHKQ